MSTNTRCLLKGLIVTLVAFTASVAQAGRGSSSAAIAHAIATNSVDGIVAELERAENLPCTGCIAQVIKLIDHDSPKVRDVAGWWLTRRGARVEVLQNMQARFVGSDPLAARNAADVLGAMRDLSSVPALGAYIKSPLDEDSGRAAAKALGNIGHPTAKAHLQAGFASTLPGVRAGSVAAVRNLRAPIGQRVIMDASTVIPLLADTSAEVRREAALTAGYLGDASAVASLIDRLSNDTDPTVRKTAAWALGELKDGTARTALQTASTSDAAANVRSLAAASLKKLR